MAGYVLLDCCPTPTRISGDLTIIKQKTGCVYQSIYRAADVEALLHQCGKHSQSELYQMYLNGTGNPANPPGFSTHERRSDGVAYPQWTRGIRIPAWACGIDVDDAHVAEVCAAARELGWIVTVTYPGDPREYHHVNFRVAPKIIHIIPILKNGSHGRRVKRLTKKLHFIKRHGEPYLHQTGDKFNDNVEAAVKRFQADHHQTADGVVGPHTRAQLAVSYRNQKVQNKIADLQKQFDNARTLAKNLHDKDPKEAQHQHERAVKLAAEIRKLGGKPTNEPIKPKPQPHHHKPRHKP